MEEVVFNKKITDDLVTIPENIRVDRNIIVTEKANSYVTTLKKNYLNRKIIIKIYF